MKEEIDRIAKTAGAPLSRASSAGKYIYESISKHITEETEPYLKDAFTNIPIIVIEKIGAESDQIKIHRELFRLTLNA